MGNKSNKMQGLVFDKPGVAGYLNGGLGNQLFIIAATYAYCLENDRRFFVSEEWEGISKSRPSYWNTLLKNITSFVNEKQVRLTKQYYEKRFSYDKIPVFNHNIVLRGYFQSPKYFEKYESEIRKLFELPEELKDFAKEKLKVFKNQTLVAVHIRRGDYVKQSDFHKLQSLSYYKDSQDYIEKKLGFRPTYLYFSDDTEWVRNNFKFENFDIIISCEKDYEEFALMQQCHHFIISNSTFSWWAAYLGGFIETSENKIVVAPEKWFGPKGPQNWYDIYDKRWTIFLNYNDKDYVEIQHKFWRDCFKIEDNLRFIRGKDSGNLFIQKDKLILLWDNWKSENSIKNLQVIKSNNNYLNELQNSFIASRMTLSDKINLYDLFLINLEHRTDRKESFLKNLPSGVFNINFMNAIKHKKGEYGVGLSHLYLIQYAKMFKLPYIIVAEDDAFFVANSEKILEILNILSNNLDKWTIFNGSPTFGDVWKRPEDFEISKSFNESLLNCTWGQSAAFMIYNSSVYDNLLEYNFDMAIDQFYSIKFIQTIFNKPFVIQKASYSDIENKSLNKNYEKYFYEQYSDFIYQCKPRENIYTSNQDISKLFFMCILSCEKYKCRRDSQDLTDNIFEYRYFIGNPSLSEALEDKINKIVYLPCKDDYESLTLKTYYANKWILQNFSEIRYIIKTDDDISFNFNELYITCKNLLLNGINHGGFVIKLDKDTYSDYHINKEGIKDKRKTKLKKTQYCAGGCYFLSRISSEIIDAHLLEDYSKYEDHSVGYCLQKYGNIFPKDLKVRNRIAFWS